jgi:hypothetical protein
LIPLAQMAQLLGVSTGTVKIWHHAGIVSGQRYNDKAKSSTTRPHPTRPPIKDAATTPCDLHERHLAANRSEEVQYATRGFARGVRDGVFTTVTPWLGRSSPGDTPPGRTRAQDRSSARRICQHQMNLARFPGDQALKP